MISKRLGQATHLRLSSASASQDGRLMIVASHGSCTSAGSHTPAGQPRAIQTVHGSLLCGPHRQTAPSAPKSAGQKPLFPTSRCSHIPVVRRVANQRHSALKTDENHETAAETDSSYHRSFSAAYCSLGSPDHRLWSAIVVSLMKPASNSPSAVE